MTIEVLVPTREKNKEGNRSIFFMDGFCYRLITNVMHMMFAKKSLKWFHLTPFKKLWQSPVTGCEQYCRSSTLHCKGNFGKFLDHHQASSIHLSVSLSTVQSKVFLSVFMFPRLSKTNSESGSQPDSFGQVSNIPLSFRSIALSFIWLYIIVHLC